MPGAADHMPSAASRLAVGIVGIGLFAARGRSGSMSADTPEFTARTRLTRSSTLANTGERQVFPRLADGAKP